MTRNRHAKALASPRPAAHGPAMPGFALPHLALLAALLLAAAPASAQNWPAEGGLNQDAIAGAFSRFDRLGSVSPRQSIGDERRETVAGWLGGVREWLDDRLDMVGERDRAAADYFDLRRSWEREWNLGR